MIGELVTRLIAAGTPADVAASVVAEAFAAGCNSGGIQVDSAAEKRRAWDRQYKRNKKNSGGIQVESGGIEKPPLTISNKIKKEREVKKPIPPEWSADLSAATSLGLTETEALREVEKFKNHAAANGRKAIKWDAAWRNWCIKAAEYMGRAPPPTAQLVELPGFYAAFSSPELEAWNAYEKTLGKSTPRDKSGGWRFPTRWPPGHGECAA